MANVFVGLSGGVDSAVSAALLQRSGHEVTGVFIKIWSPEFLECTWKRDRTDAMRVCVALGIPFRELDLSAHYRRDVVDSMVRDYAGGVTPNPDVLCNEKIKFGAFAQWAFGEGAERIATGHYARIQRGKLLRGVDIGKDQSYFLYRMPRELLDKTLLPIGELRKSEVRALAKRLQLPVAGKPDSQGLCFIGEISMPDFLARYIALQKGAVVDLSGERIGTHAGTALYTIGQRHGFEVEGKYAASGPHYVVAIDATTNTLRVSADRADAGTRAASIEAVHWLGERPALPQRFAVQTRYHETPVPAIARATHGGVEIAFEEPHIASAGQSLVLYDGDVCVGGGVIARR